MISDLTLWAQGDTGWRSGVFYGRFDVFTSFLVLPFIAERDFLSPADQAFTFTKPCLCVPQGSPVIRFLAHVDIHITGRV